ILLITSGLLSCIITLVFGIAFSIITGVFLTAFGELVENSEISKNTLLSIERKLEAKASTVANTSYTAGIAQPPIATAQPSTTQQSTAKPVETKQSREQDEMSQMWKCPNCNNFNFANSNECMNCHTKVKFTS
ncbi:MAG: Ran-binding zinc finger domain-containing protein, partial [Acutalibacteraceae bacterium]|nr:Ran-binding zinc finger domain-containing protein [Acutalibacteraceae bacterium]